MEIVTNKTTIAEILNNNFTHFADSAQLRNKTMAILCIMGKQTEPWQKGLNNKVLSRDLWGLFLALNSLGQNGCTFHEFACVITEQYIILTFYYFQEATENFILLIYIFSLA